MVVPIADKLDNARTLIRELRIHGEKQPGSERARRPAEARWYFAALADRLPALRPGPSADGPLRTCADLDRLIAAELAGGALCVAGA